MRGARTIRDLVAPTFRAMRWLPMLAACAAGLVAYEIARPKFAVEPPIPQVTRAMRIAMLVIAIGVPFVLDDPSEETVASAPARLWARRAVRIALAAPVVAAVWLGLVRYASFTLEHLPTFSSGLEPVPPPAPTSEAGIPVWGLARQFLALVTTALALSALGARLLPERIGSIAAGPGLLALVGATMLLPRKLTLYVVDPRQRLWGDARARWTIALVVALVWLWHLCRDPGRPRWRARIRTALQRKRSAPIPSDATALRSAAHRRGSGGAWPAPERPPELEQPSRLGPRR